MSWRDTLPPVRGKLLFDEPLAPFTWFRVGGPADVLFLPADNEDLRDFLQALSPDVPLTILGVGSNVIIRDGGVEGVVIRCAGRAFGEVLVDGDLVIAGPAALDAQVARAAANAGLAGLEFYAGIPGTIGGAVTMNAGCYGRETKDVLVSATAYDRTGEFRVWENEDFGFTYRHTVVEPNSMFWNQIVFRGTPDDPAAIKARMDAITARRETTQPIREKTGGSTFKNPPGHSSWKLVDEAGWRGKLFSVTGGGAMFSPLHSNFMINPGDATAADLEGLGEAVRADVLAKTGIQLDWEIKRIGRPLPTREKSMRRAALLAALSLFATSALAAEPADTAAALRDRARTDATAWTVLEDLTTTVGPRLVGSPGMALAKDWAVKTFTDMGFVNVKVEEFAKPSWARGAESASIVGPYPFQLSILGLGRTIPTPKKGIEAEVVVFKSYAALLAAPVGSLTGKIAVVNQPMTRTQDGQGYGAAGAVRRTGAIEASRRGAVALLIRSVSTSDSRMPHTGVMGYADDLPKIPAAALGVPDADLIERLAARGPVRIKLSLASTVDPNGVAWNISGEIPGSAKPEEVIVIGGHLDSWDPGTGAIDDASGIAITTAAAKLIGDLPKHPRRTIRVVMWGSEESGGSSEAYLAAHKDELPNIVMASESDLGADSIYALMLPKDAMKAPALAELPTVLAPLSIFVSRDPAPFGGSDVEGLQEAGVPVFTLRQSALRYFDLHHSGDDTLDKVDPVQLNQNVAAWAALLYMLADSDADFRPKPAAGAPKAP